MAYSKGHFYIAEGGELAGGRILRVDREGRVETLVDSLPTMGDHHTNRTAIDSDGNICCALGTATNSGVVGPDNAKFRWLKRKPDFHDVPCRDLRLRGEVFSSVDVLAQRSEVRTTAFGVFGEGNEGQSATGRVPCSGAILRIAPEGGEAHLVAWGFRNPFGLAFSRTGSPKITRGEQVFFEHCHQCHTGGEAALAPALNNKPLPGFMIRMQTRRGLGAMPAFPESKIKDDELDDLVVYLKALRKTH